MTYEEKIYAMRFMDKLLNKISMKAIDEAINELMRCLH